MRNPILTQLNNYSPRQMPQSVGNCQTNMLQQFAEFKRQMQGRNPQQMVEHLLQSGRMSPQQFEQLKRQAIDLQSLLK